MTTVVYYDEVALGRWVEEAVRKAGITVILGAVLRDVNRRRPPHQANSISRRAMATSNVAATGFVDASATPR